MRRLDCRAEFNFDGADEAGAMTFSGYGAVFGNLDTNGNVIERGAFKRTLRESRSEKRLPAMLLQHGLTSDYQMPVGVWTQMREDDRGLYVEGQLADTVRGREIYALMKMEPRPALDGLSIGYRIKRADAGTKPDEPARRLLDIDLIEVSLVTFPGNTRARVTDVNAAGDMTIREFEAFLRDEGGFSHAAARAIARDGFKQATDPRDEDGAIVATLQDAARRLRS